MLSERGLAPKSVSPRILVVDDAPMNIKILASMLRKMRVFFETAQSGKEALEKLNQGNFNVVLTDLQMPGISGDELARKIRKDEKFKDIKIGVITAETGENAFDKTLFDKVMIKPITPADLYGYIYGR